jgi:hypothetical protein
LKIVAFHDLPFTMLTPALTAHERRGHMPRTPVQPAAQFDLPGQSPGQPRQIREHRLRDVFGPMRVAIDQPHGRRINKINVARHQFAKRFFRAVGGVIRQQCPLICHLSTVKRRPEPNPTKYLSLFQSAGNPGDCARCAIIASPYYKRNHRV